MKSTSKIMENATRTSTTKLRRHGLQWVRTSWDDCTRAQNSSLGPNISDWTLMLKNNTVLPCIRRPNFEDKTITIPAADMAIVVETPGGHTKAITFQKYLDNFGVYTPGIPDHIKMSARSDELVTIRNIAIIVPEDDSGMQEMVPTCYSYGTNDNKDPQNILGASFHMGVGVGLDEVGQKKIYLVKSNGDGTSKDDTTHEFPTEITPELRSKMIDGGSDSFSEFIRNISTYYTLSEQCEDMGIVSPSDILMLANMIHGSSFTGDKLTDEYLEWEQSKPKITYDSSIGKTYEKTWFRITNESMETDEQKEAVGTVLGTRSSGVGRNRVQCFQIPRVQKPPEPKMRGFSDYGASACACEMYADSSTVDTGCSVGNVSYGSGAGKYSLDSEIKWERNKDQAITITYAYYFTTKDGNMTDRDIDHIAEVLAAGYQDSKAEWVGSLVTGEKDTSISSKSEKAPIILPNMTAADFLKINQKVTMFPKKMSDVTIFPGDE